MPILFSYGSLQNESTQRKTFGRCLASSLDRLAGFRQTDVPIVDAARAALHRSTHYANVVPTQEEGAAVKGSALEVTDEELALADGYERLDGYRRIAVTLESGSPAWVYVAVIP